MAILYKNPEKVCEKSEEEKACKEGKSRSIIKAGEKSPAIRREIRTNQSVKRAERRRWRMNYYLGSTGFYSCLQMAAEER